MLKYFLTSCVLFSALSLLAQTGAINGRIISKETGAPIEDATLFLIGATRLSTFSDKDGAFRFERAPEGAFEVIASRVGFQTEKKEIVVKANQTTEVEFVLMTKGLRVAEIVVTAKEETRGAELGTTSRIERRAIEHVQPFSLADILQLAPGQLAENPNLQSPRQVLLRQVPTNAEGAFMNAFGTSIVLDDAPVSNNANLQSDVTILNSAPTAQPPFSSVAGRGLDLRQIATNNIESVEIIRGIPSARHGDLTAGAILVQTRAGAFPLQTRARLNPNIFETALGQGFEFRNQKTALAFDLNYLESLDDPRRIEEQFNRLTGQLTWSERWTTSLNSNVRLSFFSTVDERQRYPEDDQFEREQFARERGFRYNANLVWKFGEMQTSKIEFVSSATYTQQRAAFQEKLSRNGPVALGIASTDTTTQGIYGAAEYLNRTTVEGNPLNVYARLETTLSKNFSQWMLKTLVGSEWRTDVNSGGGRQFDLATPPRQNYNVGDRPRAFDDVPALHQLSFYLEERISGKLLARNVLAQVGVRYDNLSPTSPFTGKFGTALAPRLNVAFEPAEKLWLRAGFGVTAKAPPLAFLYPNPRFFDLVGLNFFANNPAERLLIVTTRRIEPNTAPLRAAENRKVEFGLDWSTSVVNLTATAFDEVTTGGFALGRQVVPLTFPVFRVSQTNPGASPTFAFDSTGKFLGQYDAPINSRRIENQGIELTADFAEWKPIRTSLNLNLAWIYSRSTSDEIFVNTDALLSTSARGRVGIFNAGNGSERRRLVTSLRFVHRAPAVGLVVSFLAQTIWIDRDRPVGISDFPIGFLDIDGNATFLTDEQAQSDEFADLRRGLNDAVFREENPPALWLFNVRITKELSELLQVSFYANNALADRPLYAVNRNANPTRPIFQRRNQVLFFGAELVLTL
jgi:hypothetical protein